MLNLVNEDGIPVPLNALVLDRTYWASRPLLPGFCGDAATAKVIELEPGRYWGFRIEYAGVFIGEIGIEQREGGELIAECLD